ncbi:MAG: calcium:proton antiporter [Pseudomonadota bacterium]
MQMSEEHLPRRLPDLGLFIRTEIPFVIIIGTFLAFQFGADALLKDLDNHWIAAGLFVWVFGAAIWGAFGVVHHAEKLAELLGEPYGTLILTLSVVGIEVSLIAAIMLTGDSNPTLARDTMYAVVMIVLNGLVGVSLLVGALKYGQQEYNLQGARAFLAVLIPLSVFALILPGFTVSTPDPTYAPVQAAFFAIIAGLLYLVFLAIQTSRHRAFFEQPHLLDIDHETAPPKQKSRGQTYALYYHLVMLLATLIPIVMLSKRLAKLVDFGIDITGLPVALGGVMIACLVLTPESIAAIQAARDNALQRSVNLTLGAALSTIGLTMPAVLMISIFSGKSVTLGLPPASLIMLILTLAISLITFGGARTNALQGSVHLVLFLAYLMLIFSP